MHSIFTKRTPRGSASGFATAALLAAALSGCGGGGSSGGGSKPPDGTVSYPASGAFGWILKASGPTTALKYGLSLVHPGKPDTEYVIEPASVNVSDAKLMLSGSVDNTNLKVNSLQPNALIYIVGGDVRRVPMQANGAAPLSRVKRTGTTSACNFAVDGNDYAAPDNSRYLISTVGTDGKCGSAGAGRAEVQMAADGGLKLVPITGDLPLDVLRDPSTLAPVGWIYPRKLLLWNDTTGTSFPTRVAPALAITKVVASTANQALVEDSAKLGVIIFTGGGTYKETVLDSALAAGTGWQLIGYDASSFYLYRIANPEQRFNADWTVLKVTRSNPVATKLTSGKGLISVASMGSNLLYLTVFGEAENRLVRVNKTGSELPATTSATTTFTSVQTGAKGVHQVWRVTGVGSTTAAYTIELIDESSNAVLLTKAGGFPISVAEANVKNFNQSESRSRFIYASNYSAARAFNSATLEVYDTDSKTARVLGALPGSSDFGSDFGFASAIAGPSSFGLAFAARSVDGNVEQTRSKVYSYDLDTAGSLKATSIVVVK